MIYSDIILNKEQTGYIYKDKPLFGRLFINALRFHKEGIAAVLDETGAYHINIEGDNTYKQRYNRTFGYYSGKAGVVKDKKAFHIDIKGSPIYSQKYLWTGNYQQDICAVKNIMDNYFHIDSFGNRLYKENYKYVGDYREDIACVQQFNNQFTHIYKDGSLVHHKLFFDLNVYHKGYACAKDDKGWCHIDLNGIPIYEARFAMLEPFYNGLALATNFDGEKIVIDETGVRII